MKIILEDSDFKELINNDDNGTSNSFNEISARGSDEDMEKKIFEALPKILASRLKKIRNNLDGFDLQAFDLAVDVGGKPLGVGISGKLTLKYAKE